MLTLSVRASMCMTSFCARLFELRRFLYPIRYGKTHTHTHQTVFDSIKKLLHKTFATELIRFPTE